MLILSFCVFLLGFLAVGLSSYLKSRGTKQDYYLASQSINPALAGLSAVATNNSGYMFIGVIGYTYATGLASIWLMIGWIVGDFVGSTFIHKRLRKSTESSGEVSYSGVLSNWHQAQPILQKLIALISLTFLLAYAGAQLVAGSKALHVLFEWPQWAGAVIGAILVGAYCIAGGIRASIWTDAAQSIVMIFAMGTLLAVAVIAKGGMSNAIEEMSQVQGFLDLFPKDMAVPGVLGGLLFAFGWGFAGMSVIGQPHVMVRFMSLGRSQDMHTARLWYYLWFTAFYCMATGVGMLSRIFLTDAGSFDAELALPLMALELLPPIAVGLILAGVFAATMSTADSLVLSCSSAFTHDILPHNIENTRLLKIATIGITVTALFWALLNKQSVFSLVLMAWSGLASAFAPLLIVLCLGGRPNQILAILMVIIGLATALLWRLLGWNDFVYESMPGILIGLLVFFIGYVITKLVNSQGAALESPPQK